MSFQRAETMQIAIGDYRVPGSIPEFQADLEQAGDDQERIILVMYGFLCHFGAFSDCPVDLRSRILKMGGALKSTSIPGEKEDG